MGQTGDAKQRGAAWVRIDAAPARFAATGHSGSRSSHAGFEQRPGEEAVGKVLSWTPEADAPKLVLDLTAAYPPEAGLLMWRRSLEHGQPEGQTAAGMVLTDTFETRQAGQKIRHVLWSLE